jgi:hypothetical protein
MSLPLLPLLAAMPDLSPGRACLEAFLRTRASLDGTETVFHWTGEVHAFPEGAPGVLLFSGEGFNVARLERVEGGWRMLSREVFLYRDPGTGAILESWANPMTGDTVGVVPVLNDPVNAVFLESRDGEAFDLPHEVLPGGILSWNVSILVAYPSPLPRDSFPLNSASDTYQGAELFHFFSPLDALGDTSLSSVPCTISWTRFGQWLPWMEMGDRPGWLVYSCTGSKLGCYAELPEDVRAFVDSAAPEFAHAPVEYTRPNCTSWTYFRRLLGEGRTR